MKWTRFAVGLAVALSWGISAWGQQTETAPIFRWGGDIRLRQEYFDEIPIIKDPPGVTRGGENNYFRVRTRLWGEVDLAENITFRARIVNEFRDWQEPDQTGKPESSTYEFPDEYVFDNLYLEFRKLAGKKIDLRIGRQDMMYGNGMLIAEGTPKDGSRTVYFNAVKLTVNEIENNSIDVFGFYNDPEDEWAINSVDRDLTGYASGLNGLHDSGGGVYLKNKAIANVPFEAYAIYKNEGNWYQQVNSTTRVDHAQLDLGTFGFLLKPSFGHGLSGSLEAAYQTGDREGQDVSAYGADASLSYNLPFLQEAGASVYSGVYCLSGDDPATTRDEGWNPLWARYPQYSELYVYAWDAEGAARWSNLLMPRIGLKVKPTQCKWISGSVMAAYLWAMEDDGPGPGKDRGFLQTVKIDFNIYENLLCKKDKLTGHLVFEALEPGDYYNVDSTALFARWQLNYEF